MSKRDRNIKVLRMGWPLVQNVPTSCGSTLTCAEVHSSILMKNQQKCYALFEGVCL